ncbi:MAG: AbrB/MazE/SpoVT family DNA-binding domain-containing protein [Patulibacter sp.]
MTYRVGPKGQVVLPKALRDELGILPGDQVDVARQGDGLLVRRARAGSRLYRQLASSDLDLLRDLRVEREREAAKDAER